MTLIRRLNNIGLEKFTDYIQKLKAGVDIQYPEYLLDSIEFSEDCEIDVEVEQVQFKSRYELGKYLVGKFADIDMQPYLGDRGVWSWLALFWFKQLCPVVSGKFKPSEAHHYVLSQLYNHRPRHSVLYSWQLVELHGEDSLFMLAKKPSVRGELSEQLLARQYILYSKGVIALANHLYFDANTESFKRGAAGRGKGGVTRLISWIRQIDLTYDIFSMEKEDFVKILPSEFGRFLS
ncbi:hypothetical protein KIH87_04550 [Paraneptunicella aestuarii]|uniref:hypothetical protein n=1 Tax=Paraneptunicella aestuarii TaxID=2831148 RepID=UPI001E57B9B7|nr:hypothetical protein [Paraneptunicella aestuarii]UAA39632.1 hypothetical protein KIH87_04550 [Paraneptunicella aestuarii]